ncbi:hypothetical protein DV532_26095 (plasmid) [Pseudomonas sp. Leaf58]|uniref:hypothetical protein n=1 Tax=Pseudomonas sp. Leaf58 TaxID=1736226 RepID=UPI0006F43D5D|nr:hypothetical protein [Pseudomonas sp. Leaf58]AYG47760.1 hypothetical protein DV532_26095 [Pseudomonas sp. Leaf58]KQN62673.1 hypothetical protein ASF02_11035 [Pseudomonas sp. Leaf58]
MPKTQANSVKSIVFLLVLTIFLTFFMLAIANVRDRDRIVKREAMEVLSIYQKDPQIHDPKPIEAYHNKGYGYATALLIKRAEQKSDFQERDRLLSEAASRFTNIELAGLLIAHRESFDPQKRAELLIEAAKMPSGPGVDRLLQRATTILPEDVQAAMLMCSKLLSSRYDTGYETLDKTRFTWDYIWQTRSCRS